MPASLKQLKTAPKSRPVYAGQKFSANDKEGLLCHNCSNLATHSARFDVKGTNDLDSRDIYFCEEDLNAAIKAERPMYKVRELPKYRLFRNRMDKWVAAQHFNESQDAMF